MGKYHHSSHHRRGEWSHSQTRSKIVSTFTSQTLAFFPFPPPFVTSDLTQSPSSDRGQRAAGERERVNDVVAQVMSSEDDKSRGLLVGHHHESHPPPPPEQLPPPGPPPHCGTFEGVPAFPPPCPPAVGFPQPMPPPGASDPQYYAQGYQIVPGIAVAEGHPIAREYHRLPCCGLGLGWFMFIIGFFLAGIPWYLAAVLMVCTRRTMDYREKPGYIVCTVAAILETIAIIFGATRSH